MSKPATFADFGTTVPGAAAPAATRRSGRFHDVRAVIADQMPSVKVGQIYADMDPRCEGRQVQVLKVTDDHRVMVRTITPRTCEPRTPAKTGKDMHGAVSFIALRRFKPGTRGFRLLRTTTLRQAQAYLVACKIAALNNLDVTEMEMRVADALIGLLGSVNAVNAYLDHHETTTSHTRPYLTQGATALFDGALDWASSRNNGVDAWASIPITSHATARAVARSTHGTRLA